MSKFTVWLRKYTGSIIATLGMVLLAILTYGDLGELFTDEYWRNVGGNLSSIGALSIGLVMIQVSIKQGISEQALSAGLNTQTTKGKYETHKGYITKNQAKYIYMPYFLAMRNKRETKIRKREFLVDNNFTSERDLFISKNKKLIKKYRKIKTNITAESIKWSTTEIVYNADGTIEKLDTYRKRRAIRGLIQGIFFMFGATLITGGMFLDPADIPFWQKTVKLITYAFIIGITAIIDIGKNYEKGAFGVPNELDEINSIWEEFQNWEVPQWTIDEVDKNSKSQEYTTMLDEDIKKLPAPQDDITTENETPLEENIIKEELDSEQIRENSVDTGTDLQEESEEIKNI